MEDGRKVAAADLDEVGGGGGRPGRGRRWRNRLRSARCPRPHNLVLQRAQGGAVERESPHLPAPPVLPLAGSSGSYTYSDSAPDLSPKRRDPCSGQGFREWS